MKKIFGSTVLLLAFCTAVPQFSSDYLKAENLNNENQSVEIRTGVVIGINIFGFGGSYLILDDSTGDIYSYDFSGSSDLRVNDNVIYSLDKACERIIVRPVIRK